MRMRGAVVAVLLTASVWSGAKADSAPARNRVLSASHNGVTAVFKDPAPTGERGDIYKPWALFVRNEIAGEIVGRVDNVRLSNVYVSRQGVGEGIPGKYILGLSRLQSEEKTHFVVLDADGNTLKKETVTCSRYRRQQNTSHQRPQNAPICQYSVSQWMFWYDRDVEPFFAELDGRLMAVRLGTYGWRRYVGPNESWSKFIPEHFWVPVGCRPKAQEGSVANDEPICEDLGIYPIDFTDYFERPGAG